MLISLLFATAISLTSGSVQIDCAEAGEWQFVAKSEQINGREVVSIRMDAPGECAPPRFKVAFSDDAPGSDHVWLSHFTKTEYHLWPSAWVDKWKNRSQLASETPIAVAFDNNERATLAIACSEVFEAVDYWLNVKETTAKVCGGFEFFTEYASPRSAYEVKIMIDRRPLFWAEAVKGAAEWITRTRGFTSPKVPESAFDSLYSTWYAYFQEVYAEPLEREAEKAAALGMKTMILDDGWQKVKSKTFYSATGDWQPAPSRFADMKAHVAKVHATGMKYMIWVAVPFVGEESAAWGRFKDKLLHHNVEGKVGTLDPRFPEVREYLIGIYERMIGEWDFDGIKLDFIDELVIRGEDPAIKDGYAGRDFKSVPEAVDKLMKDILARLKAIKPEVMIEFRQSYMGAAILQYGHMMRACDCPADMWTNRKRICDLRLTSGSLAVHSDMLVWNKEETREGAALPILSALFSTIQFSMILADAKAEHLEVIRHWIKFGEEHRETLLHGDFRPRHPEQNFPIIEARSREEEIIAVYSPSAVAQLEMTRSTYLVNATMAESLVVELAKNVEWTTYDTVGAKAGHGSANKGLNRINIPKAGYVQFEIKAKD